MASTITRQASRGFSGTGRLAGTGALALATAGLDSAGRTLLGAFGGGAERTGAAAEGIGNADAGGAEGNDGGEGKEGKDGAGGSSSAPASRLPAGRAGL
jgi:hypothetical protein